MGSAPRPDPQIGEAAKLSAQTGQEMLNFMRDQSQITNAWGLEDRDRFKSVFEPLQDQFIADAQAWDTPGRRQARQRESEADVRQGFATAADARRRTLGAYGVRPDSGRFGEAERRTGNEEALAVAGARNLSNRAVEGEGEARMANAINLGQGLGVNPATSIGLSNNAVQTGGAGAMQGYGQQGRLLQTDFDQRMSAYNSSMGIMGGLAGAAGKLVGSGALAPLLSSKDAKTDKAKLPEGEALGAVREMPVEQWRYKDGMGADGGAQPHVGPYAEDVGAATGQGDRKTLDVADTVGMALGAIKDLAAKVDALEARAA